MSNEFNETMRIEIPNDKKSINEIIKIVNSALDIGYILSGDPTYITSYNNARGLIRQVSRDEILEEFLENYIKD